MRNARSWTRRDLADRTGISERFLADIETGKANPSLLKLCEVADALGTTAVGLLSNHLTAEDDRRNGVLALLGLRGAGKSSVGRSLADNLGCPLIELDAEIERTTGLELDQIFQMYDQTYYRRAEQDTLRTLLVEHPRPFVLATGGGLVTERATYDLLRAHSRTIWLRAKPEDHWSRVIAQGDTRPMGDDEQAFAALCNILGERRHLYEQAEITVETHDRTIAEIANELTERFRNTPTAATNGST